MRVVKFNESHWKGFKLPDAKQRWMYTEYDLMYCISIIHKSSGIKNTLMKYTPIYIEGYIKRAVELGIIEQDDIETAKKELNPYKEIEIGFWNKGKA